jgi:hypothetical protein
MYLRMAGAILAAMMFASAAWAGGEGQAPAPSEQPAGTAATTPMIEIDPHLLPSPTIGQRGVQVRANILSNKSFQAGSTVDFWPAGGHPETPAIVTRHNDARPVELGGFVGYLFPDDNSGMPQASVGLDLQFATNPQSSAGGWLVQPGLDYTTSLAPSWQLNTRLFSTYAAEGYSSGPFGPERQSSLHSESDPTFQDVGVGLGLGYAIDDKWNIQTQARYQRMLGTGETPGQKETPAHQFFGGVMVDYKF